MSSSHFVHFTELLFEFNKTVNQKIYLNNFLCSKKLAVNIWKDLSRAATGASDFVVKEEKNAASSHNWAVKSDFPFHLSAVPALFPPRFKAQRCIGGGWAAVPLSASVHSVNHSKAVGRCLSPDLRWFFDILFERNTLQTIFTETHFLFEAENLFSTY